MASWQRRAGSRHHYYVARFYRDGRRCHEYMGRGTEAIQAAEAAAQRWADLQAAWAVGRAERQELAATNAPLHALDEDMEVLMRAVLYAAGFRQLDRHWRTNPHAS